MKTDARPPRQTARQKRADDYALMWEKNRKQSALRRPVRKHDRILRGPELVHAIERMRDATGDPGFETFLDLVYHYGFDREFERTATQVQLEMFGDPEDDCLEQVAFLHKIGKLEEPDSEEPDGRRRRLSLFEACEHVAAETGLPAASFEAAVERLRKRYQAKRPAPRAADLERAIALSLTVRLVE